MSIFSKIITLFLFSISLLFTHAILAASQDDYLKQLEMEANDEGSSQSSVIDSQSGIPSDDGALKAPSSDMELIHDKKELISDNTGFEKALRDTYPESFSLFQELTDEQKTLIYQDFKKNKRLYNSTVKIISIYLGSH